MDYLIKQGHRFTDWYGSVLSLSICKICGPDWSEMSTKLLLLILTLSAVPVSGQTVSDIEKTLGKPTLAYSVTEHIWMTPDFASDGQVCRMRFYTKRVEGNTINLDGHLKSSELKSILNQIVPPSSRGNKKNLFDIGNFGGGIVEADYEYEKVTFTFVYSFRITIDVKALKQSGEVVPLDGFPVTDLPKPSPPSESDFDNAGKPEIVILRWNDRTCIQDNKGETPERVAEIEQRFGQPQKIYSVGSYTSMSADYAADGQVCRMYLYPRRVSGSKSYLGTTLESVEVTNFLNSFVPPEQRGLQQEVNFGTTATGGPFAWTTYPYENVYFTFRSSWRPQKYNGSILRKGEFKFSIPYSDPPPPRIKDRSPSKEDFRLTGEAQMADVHWLQRTCVAP